MIEKIMVTREMLLSVKRIALRKRVWFSVLGETERAVITLTVRCVEKVRSSKLTEIVLAIVSKLREAVKGDVERLTETVGKALARKLSLIALKWNHKDATNWERDSGFIQFLTVSYMNSSNI